MDVTETDLPGVGKKHEVDLGDDRRLVVVTHNTGKRQVYLKPEDGDSEELFELSDRQARTVGTILEGAHFQPVAADNVETLLAEETMLEWYAVDDGSPLVGKTPVSADIRQRTGATVLAIQRDDGVVADAVRETTIEPGDTLVVVGDREACDAVGTLLSGTE